MGIWVGGSRARPSVLDGRGAAVITVDDGWAEQAALADQVEARGGRLTLYVNGNIGTAGRLTAAQLADLYRRGHEIGWHGTSHLDMTALTTTTRATEWSGVSAIEAIIGASVRHFAYPFGTRTNTTDVEAYGRFASVRGTGGLLAGTPRLFRSEEKPFLWYGFDWGAVDNHAYMMELARIAGTSGEIVTPYFHRPDATDNPTSAQITALLDVLTAGGVPMLTVSDAMGRTGQRLINPDFAAGTTVQSSPLGWFLATGGTPTVTVDTSAAAVIDGLAGSSALKISLPAASGHFAYGQQIVSVKPGRSYTLASQAKVSAASGPRANVRIGWYTADATSIGGGPTGSDYVSTSWGRTTATGTAPVNAVRAKLDLLGQTLATGATVGGDIWHRHVWFGEAGQGVYA